MFAWILCKITLDGMWQVRLWLSRLKKLASGATGAIHGNPKQKPEFPPAPRSSGFFMF